MKSTPQWLSKKALLVLHEQTIATFGGARGVRDEGLLDSALARPMHLQAYRPDCTLAELAAAAAYGLARNHPFIDGNKRIAFLSIGVFLAINGFRLTAARMDAIQAMLALADGQLDESALAAWIARHLSPHR